MPGTLTIPLVAAARTVRTLVFFAGLIPRPGMSMIDQLQAGEPIFVDGFVGMTK